VSIQSHSVAIATTRNLAVDISPGSWNQTYSNAQSPQAMPFTATGSGGVPGYSYAWDFLSGGTGMVLSGETTAVCTVTVSGSDQLRTGTLRCTVTDAASGTAVDTAGIQVTFGTPP
jgi:hypothetical protein